MSHIPAQDESFIGKTMGSGLALSLLSIILAQSLNLYLDLGFRPEACLTVGLVVTIWVFPTTLWLLYHRISLPTWLTFGHPVSFGGVRPNVCNSTFVPGLMIDRPCDWACFPSELQTRLARVIGGPERLKYLFQLDLKIIACFIFLAMILGMVAAVVHELRQPR